MSEVSNLQTSPNSKKQPHFWGTFGELKLKKALQISVTPFSAEREVSSENATEWLVWAIFRIKVTTDLLSV